MWIRRRQQIFLREIDFCHRRVMQVLSQKGDFTFEAICSYARTQNVMPYIVIGRLQKEKYLDYHQYSNYKLRYKWGDCS